MNIRKTDVTTARSIAALVNELKGDQDLLDRLTEHDYGKYGAEKIDVCKWLDEQNKNDRNLWRVKSADLADQGPKYRIIYAFEPAIKRHVILAIVHRDIAYDIEHPTTQRIRDDYDKLIAG